jgi:hypothetical protein
MLGFLMGDNGLKPFAMTVIKYRHDDHREPNKTDGPFGDRGLKTNLSAGPSFAIEHVAEAQLCNLAHS